MKKLYKYRFIILILYLFFLNSCADDPAPGLWPDLVGDDRPVPVINSINPPNEALAGISEITLNGENFSPNTIDNGVYFNGIPGVIINSTTTQIQVKVPSVIADSVEVKVRTFKVENFSNIFIYKLVSATEEYYSFDPNNQQYPLAITFDQTGNLLVSLEGKGIYKVTPSKEFSEFIPKGSETKWDDIRIFNNGDVFAARLSRGIWKLTENVIPPNQPWALTPSGTFLLNFDFDKNINLWAVGSNNFIFRIKQDQSVAQYSFAANLRAVRVFENHLYVAGLKAGVEGIWKIPIDENGNLSQEELYFNLTDNYPGIVTNTITFSEDGDLLLGTNKTPDPIIIVHPDGTSESLYPGVIPAREILSMYWPQGNYLYVTRARQGSEMTQTVLRIDVEKPGALYYVQ